MSSFSSDKCTELELRLFKDDVVAWLDENFPSWRNKFKIKAYDCYNGDVRLYDGTYNEFPNSKSSFRRETADTDQNGKIIGWQGTRGIHKRKYVNYISINRDEFEKIKKDWIKKDGEDYFFNKDLIFDKLH